MNTESPAPDAPNMMAMILEQLTALQITLASQEARHHDEMEALRRDLTSQITSATSTPLTQNTPAENTTAPDPSLSGTGSMPARPTPNRTINQEQNSHRHHERSERLPDPPMFTGKRKELPLFLTRLRFKLEGNADRYPTPRSALIYAHSRLERDPATIVDSMIHHDIHTVEQLVSFLKATYDDPNKELSAWSKLDSLKQGKRAFLSHFAEFRRLVADTDLNENAQISYLRRTLSDDLRRAMVGVPVPNNLNDYANLISLYDNDLRYLPRSTQRTHTTSRYPEAMEIDASNYAPAGSKEREERRKKGLCYKCGKHGHISRDCLVPLPQTRSNSIPATRRRGSTASSTSSTVSISRPSIRSSSRKAIKD